jgi:hypothetical protein
VREIKLCTRCKVQLPLDEFSPGHCFCKLCHTLSRRERRICRDVVNEFLDEFPCSDCERHFPPCALHFDHHPDAPMKEHTIADLMSRAATRENVEHLWSEIVKCEVVCAVCHAIRTNKRAEEKHQRRLEERAEYIKRQQAT